MKKIDWNKVKEQYSIGKIIEGRVMSHRPFGVFLDIGDLDIIGIIGVIDFLNDDNSSRPYPKIDTIISCKVIGYTDDERNQLWLSSNPTVLSGEKLPFGF
jgi:ribosomal protein S1